MIVQKAELVSHGSGLEMEGSSPEAIDQVMRHFFSQTGCSTLVLVQHTDYEGRLGIALEKPIVVTIERCDGVYVVKMGKRE